MRSPTFSARFRGSLNLLLSAYQPRACAPKDRTAALGRTPNIFLLRLSPFHTTPNRPPRSHAAPRTPRACDPGPCPSAQPRQPRRWRPSRRGEQCPQTPGEEELRVSGLLSVRHTLHPRTFASHAALTGAHACGHALLCSALPTHPRAQVRHGHRRPVGRPVDL